jgi:hypothetical protein
MSPDRMRENRGRRRSLSLELELTLLVISLSVRGRGWDELGGEVLTQRPTPAGPETTETFSTFSRSLFLFVLYELLLSS